MVGAVVGSVAGGVCLLVVNAVLWCYSRMNVLASTAAAGMSLKCDFENYPVEVLCWARTAYSFYQSASSGPVDSRVIVRI